MRNQINRLLSKSEMASFSPVVAVETWLVVVLSAQSVGESVEEKVNKPLALVAFNVLVGTTAGSQTAMKSNHTCGR